MKLWEAGKAGAGGLGSFKAYSPPDLRFELRRLLPPLLIGLSLVAAAGHGRADPHAVFPSGLPVQVVPKFPEPGLPAFSYPQGAPDTGRVTDAVDVGTGQGGGGGIGYKGAGNGVSGATLAQNYSDFVGQSVGSGECVALVQAASNVGLTSTWSPGTQVQGNTDIAAGTVIATFGADATYTNTYGPSHAAIYLGQNSTGIQVEDQWLGQPAQIRTIPWITQNSYESQTRASCDRGWL